MPSASQVRDRIALRARVTRATRAFFDERGFHEVTTPVLSPQLIVDAHIDPFETVMYPDPRRPQEGPRWYLRTSPEAHMKRLVAAGAEAIYQLAPVFRAGEHGPLHNPEFTMLEWYRLDDRLADAIRFTNELLAHLIPSVPPGVSFTYQQAFRAVLSLDPLAASDAEVSRRVAQFQGPVGSRDDGLNFLLAEQVVPEVSRVQPAVIFGFPASQAALAAIDPSDSRVAERFELYFRGIELANGYRELECGEEMRRRFAGENQKRAASGRSVLRGDERLVEAMRPAFPACAGVALGFDRLLLLVSGTKTLDTVIAFDLGHA